MYVKIHLIWSTHTSGDVFFVTYLHLMFQCSNKKKYLDVRIRKNRAAPFLNRLKKRRRNRQKPLRCFFFPAFLDSSTLEHLGQWLKGSSRYLISATQKIYPDWLNRQESESRSPCFGEGGKFLCHFGPRLYENWWRLPWFDTCNQHKGHDMVVAWHTSFYNPTNLWGAQIFINFCCCPKKTQPSADKLKPKATRVGNYWTATVLTHQLNQRLNFKSWDKLRTYFSPHIFSRRKRPSIAKIAFSQHISYL